MGIDPEWLKAELMPFFDQDHAEAWYAAYLRVQHSQSRRRRQWWQETLPHEALLGTDVDDGDDDSEFEHPIPVGS